MPIFFWISSRSAVEAGAEFCQVSHKTGCMPLSKNWTRTRCTEYSTETSFAA